MGPRVGTREEFGSVVNGLEGIDMDNESGAEMKIYRVEKSLS